MTREQIRKFLEFVDSGAQLKSYTKVLGLNFHEYKYHLTQIPYYRTLIAEEEAVAPIVEAKPEPAKNHTTPVKSDVVNVVEDESDKQEEPEEELKDEKKSMPTRKTRNTSSRKRTGRDKKDS